MILCPGAGFDIVPTDCLAATLKERLPNAQRIDLALSFGTRPSVGGTAKTAVRGICLGGLIRRNHQLKPVPNGYRIRRIPFRDRPRWSVTIPWADVYTSGVSTGVPNGMVFTALPLSLALLMRVTSTIKGLLTAPHAQRWLMRLAEKFFSGGPGDEERANHHTQFWGEATADDGRRVIATMSAPSVYALTVDTALGIVEHCLPARNRASCVTASMLMGSGYITSRPGVELEETESEFTL